VAPHSDRLQELARIMDRAAEIALLARQDLQMDLKKDISIVTNADRAVETYLREALIQSWPGTSFWGEEFGRDSISNQGYWLIDPIDGTSNFAFGSPLWGISVALTMGTEIHLGAVWLPDLRERYFAEIGQGAHKDGQALPAIPPGPVKAHELVSYCDTVIQRYPGQSLPGKMRCAGAFVVDGAFTATQRYRGMIGRNERFYDAAASMLLCQELGADIRNADGTPLDMDALLGGEPFRKAWVMFPQESGFLLREPS